MKASPNYLKTIIFPADPFTPRQIKQWRDTIALQGLIVVYQNGDNPTEYLFLPTWTTYQYISKPYSSKIPAPPKAVPEAIPVPFPNHSDTIPALQHSIGIGIGIGIGNGICHSLTRTGMGELFDIFWDAYPKKKSKGQAERAFAQLKPDKQLLETMLSSIGRAKQSVDWLKDKGQYIPYPATWLRAKGWEDEIEPKDSFGGLPDYTSGKE